MWKQSEAVGFKPSEIDTISSKKYVYVRKDFVKSVNEYGNDAWIYLEQKVPKEDWQVYTKIIDGNDSVTDLTEAVMELAEIIGG